MHRVQPLHEVRPAAAPGRPPRLRPPGHRPPRPGDAERRRDGAWRLRRGADPAKDQSYVLSMLGQDALARVVFPVGEHDQGRRCAPTPPGSGLRTAAKPDSQDVCFIGSAEGRQGFLAERIALHPAEVVDTDGPARRLGRGCRAGDGRSAPRDGPRHRRHAPLRHPRRRGGAPGDRRRRAEDVLRSAVVLPAASLTLGRPARSPPGARAVAQVSAHGRPVAVHSRARRPPIVVVRFDDAAAPGGARSDGGALRRGGAGRRGRRGHRGLTMATRGDRRAAAAERRERPAAAGAAESCAR